MDPDKALERAVGLAATLVDSAPEAMEWEALLARATELAEALLALDEWLRNGGFSPRAWRGKKSRPAKAAASEKALRGLLQDIAEVLDRQGERWWDETVTAGTHHRSEAEKLLKRGPA